MSQQFVKASQRPDWQVAPTELQLANYDEHKITYRAHVEKMIQNISRGNLLKKTFLTISVNVLCPDSDSKSPNLDPIERDIYLPLEIALTKWTMADRDMDRSERNFKTRVWIINPGNPTVGNNVNSLSHIKFHKIDYKMLSKDDELVESDPKKVMADINSLLLPDRTVFSLTIKKCRQDLGALKWLNLKTGCKMKPINVYSLEDLFVVVNRRLAPDRNEHICLGVAQYVLNQINDSLDDELKCEFHLKVARESDEDCSHCARALAESSTHSFLDFTNLNVAISFNGTSK